MQFLLKQDLHQVAVAILGLTVAQAPAAQEVFIITVTGMLSMVGGPARAELRPGLAPPKTDDCLLRGSGSSRGSSLLKSGKLKSRSTFAPYRHFFKKVEVNGLAWTPVLAPSLCSGLTLARSSGSRERIEHYFSTNTSPRELSIL